MSFTGSRFKIGLAKLRCDKMPDRKYIFLDLETTGLDPERDEIIEIGAVKAMRGEVIDSFQVLVKPRREISYKIKKLTGITDEMLQDAPAAETVLPRLLDFIGDLPVIGHNICFDLGFINIHPGYALTNEIVDTMELARVVLPAATRYRLGSLAEKLSGAREIQHRALEDARAAADIFFKLLDILEKLDITVLRDINRLLAGSDWSGKDILRRLEERKTASFPDGKIATSYNFMSRDPELKEKFFQVPDKNNRPDKSRVLIDPAALQGSLGDDGPFARMYPDYIYRPQQADIVALAARAFNEQKHLLIEAGTGTGKSLAYLLPAIYWAVENNSRVVVATHTINLQEQLWQKDLPVIKEITGLEFQEALVKGRNNYICLRKWEQKKRQPEALTTAEKLFLARLQIWLTETLEGDRSEINLNARESALWPDVCADPDTCMGPKCSWFNNHCFFMNTRRQAEAAHILITNHSVLLSDLKTENRILPAHEYLIVDEAHNLEEQAGEQLGALVSSGAVYKTLVNLRQFVDNRVFAGETGSKESGDKALSAIKDARAGFREFTDCLLTYCQAIAEAGDDYTWHTVRIRSGQQSGRLWEALHTALENFTGRLRTVAAAMEQLYREYAGVNDGEDARAGGFLREMEYQVKIVMQIAADLNNILLAAEPDTVSWVEFDKKGEQYSLKAVPVSVGEILADRLFGVKKGVILSSATLSVDGNFTHFKERIGLTLVPEESVLEIQVSSPFNYEEQSFLGVIRDLPDPGTVPDEIFAGEIAPVLGEIAKIFQGRTMVLFTSHRMLRQAYTLLSAELAKEDIAVLGHNIDGSRTRIIEEFRTNPRAVLLGANSFWEGVDLSGDILKCVVIVKLPFAPPNLPLTEARMEKLAAMKKDGFTNLLLPQAIIRMKQGFGRLIRSERDEGVVVLLDRRITEKRYGRKFFNSLPLRSHLKGDRHMILQKLADWIDGKRAVPLQFKMITGADHFKSQPFSGKMK